ncbi:MAG: pilus assembly protein TadG-related protein [Anaerolineae bacterium]|nr:pilus assembly protein TadG-related protein [Caldilineales bacterium]MDW8267608.1 pilus assembly protein TadG-related protein [Anaerolineae bacterium]
MKQPGFSPTIPITDRPSEDREHGSTLVYVALVMMLLLAVLSLVLDGLHAYVQQRRMQNAADAAALAGARAMAVGGNVGAAVAALATANGAQSFTWGYAADGRVWVETRRHVPTWFAGLLGFASVPVRGRATADCLPLTGAGNLLPMTINIRDVVLGPALTLMWEDQLDAPGSFGWLDWNGGAHSNAELADNIANPGNSGFWRIGDLIPPSPGVQGSGPVRTALERWIGQPVTIPLYDVVVGQGANTRYRVAGFGRFILQSFDFQGRDKYIVGRFIGEVLPGEVGSGAFDAGVCDLRLLP